MHAQREMLKLPHLPQRHKLSPSQTDKSIAMDEWIVYLSSSSTPLSPRCVSAGFISVSACRLAWRRTHVRLFKCQWFKTSTSCIIYVGLVCSLTLSSQASSRISSASMEMVLLRSWSWVTSSSMPQLLKNSTLARSRTRRCLVAYNLQVYVIKP